jgi:spermidine synthase
MAWTSYIVTESLPYWPVNPSIVTDFGSSSSSTWSVLFRRAAAVILWGASFPLALASVASRDEDPARWLAGVCARTRWARSSARSASLVLTIWLGTQKSQQLMILIAAASGLLLCSVSASPPLRWHRRPLPRQSGAYRSTGPWHPRRLRPVRRVAARTVDSHLCRRRMERVGRGVRAIERRPQLPQCRQGTGVERAAGHAPAAHARPSDDARSRRTRNGRGHRLRRRRDSRRGVDRPAVEHQTIAEIEPLVPRVVSDILLRAQLRVVRNPKVHVHIDDARHFLFTTTRSSTRLRRIRSIPWVKGAAMLYTREFFELAKQHLNPGGVVTLFVQLYESNTEAVKSEIGTFFEAFPNG